MGAELTYYIYEGVLTGYVSGRMFHMSALSGGAGGSLKQDPENSANNPYMEGLKTKGKSNTIGHVHGGPIPPGKYTIHAPGHHAHLGLSARLEHPRWRPMGRDGFYIHGQGIHGSDGCVVPLDRTQFNNLMEALRKSNGGILFVQETMDGSRFV